MTFKKGHKISKRKKDWCWTCGDDINSRPIKKEEHLFCSEECAEMFE